MFLYVLVLGCLLLAAVSLLLWARRRGEFHDPEAAARRLLELDRETGVRRDD